MIVSLNLVTDTGTPGWIALEPPAKMTLFRTKTNERVEAYLGNTSKTEDNNLPKGYAVNKKALAKPEWAFTKPLYLNVSSFMIQAGSGEQYHHPVPVDQVMVFRGITHNHNLYAFMVVERSEDPRYRHWPVFV